MSTEQTWSVTREMTCVVEHADGKSTTVRVRDYFGEDFPEPKTRIEIEWKGEIAPADWPGLRAAIDDLLAEHARAPLRSPLADR